MSGESKMRRKVVEWLHGYHPVSVENPTVPGTPDVNYVEGWIELKCLDSWPIGEKTIVSIKYFKPQQRVWLKKRYQANGNVFMLLKVDNDWLLFDGITASNSVGLVTRTELFELALKTWAGNPGKELATCLQSLKRN